MKRNGYILDVLKESTDEKSIQLYKELILLLSFHLQLSDYMGLKKQYTFFEKLYIEESDKTLEDIADECNCCVKTIYTFRNRMNDIVEYLLENADINWN